METAAKKIDNAEPSKPGRWDLIDKTLKGTAPPRAPQRDGRFVAVFDERRGNNSRGGRHDGGDRGFGGGGERGFGGGDRGFGGGGDRGFGGGFNRSTRNEGGRGDIGGGKDDGSWRTRGGRRWIAEKESEVFSSTKDKTKGLNFDSYDSIAVEISGTGSESIVPLVSFKSTGSEIPSTVLENIERVNYDKPTPVQRYAIPIMLANRDLMACAQTGSGKTAAFLFPMIIQMLKTGPPPHNGRGNRVAPVGVVLSPTRELTCQIAVESKKFAFNTGIRTVVVYGGSDIASQIRQLSYGVDICVATPGRLNDLLERGRVGLHAVQYLVLDEADRMLDMGFAPQITDIIEGRDMPTSRDGRRTAMFSATFPREIQQLAANFMADYVYLTVGRVGSTSEFITQRFIYAEEKAKPNQLLQVLNENKGGRILIFTETKRKADLIEIFLCNQGLHATSIHGDRSQQERTQALDLFKSGKCPILCATDVAARGLDIHSISHVINLDLPHSIEDYVHRIGRTGRAGNYGYATSFVNEGNRAIIRDLLRLLEEAHQEIPTWLMDLARACTSSGARGFGSNRFRGNSGGGSRGNFGGVDFRNQEKRVINAGYGSSSGPSHSNQPRHDYRPAAPEGNDCW